MVAGFLSQLMNLSLLRISSIGAACALFFTPAPAWSDEDAPVRVQGVPHVAKVMRSAAALLSKQGIDIKVGEDSGNVPAITALGSGQIDIALLGRSMSAEERASYPEKKFHEFPLGAQVIVVLVSRSVWESGVRALKKEQLMDLYEGRVKSWKELGGEDRPAKFFEPAHGRGTWEIFATWLYGDMRKAPAVPWEEVPGGAEAQTAVQFQAGGASVAPYRWADKRDAFPLALIEEDGTVIEPTPENVASGKYPLTRPTFLVTGDRPAAQKRKVIEFMESAAGQEIVTNNDLLPNPPAKEPAP